MKKVVLNNSEGFEYTTRNIMLIRSEIKYNSDKLRTCFEQQLVPFLAIYDIIVDIITGKIVRYFGSIHDATEALAAGLRHLSNKESIIYTIMPHCSCNWYLGLIHELAKSTNNYHTLIYILDNLASSLKPKDIVLTSHVELLICKIFEHEKFNEKDIVKIIRKIKCGCLLSAILLIVIDRYNIKLNADAIFDIYTNFTNSLTYGALDLLHKLLCNMRTKMKTNNEPPIISTQDLYYIITNIPSNRSDYYYMFILDLIAMSEDIKAAINIVKNHVSWKKVQRERVIGIDIAAAYCLMIACGRFNLISWIAIDHSYKDYTKQLFTEVFGTIFSPEETQQMFKKFFDLEFFS